MIEPLANSTLPQSNRISLFEVAIVTGIVIAAFARDLMLGSITSIYLICHYVFRHLQNSKLPTPDSSAKYRIAIKSAVAQQVYFFVLTALMLDGGQQLHVTLVSMLGFWIVTLLGMVCRRRDATGFDLLLVRFGFLIILFAVEFIGPVVWAARGRG